MGHSEEFWQNVVNWRKKWQHILVFPSGKPHEQHEKAKRYDTGRLATSRTEGVQYATGEEQRKITNSSRKSEGAGPLWKLCSTVDVSGGENPIL